MKDEDFITKTINEGNVNIQKFPTSKVQQLAKKMESSKATAKHIRQVTGHLPGSTNPTDVTSMHSTSCQELSQEETDFPLQGGNCKATRPWKFPYPRNPLICRNWVYTLTSAPGAEIHCMHEGISMSCKKVSM